LCHCRGKLGLDLGDLSVCPSPVAGDWDNEADENHENVIESVTLNYNYFELVQ